MTKMQITIRRFSIIGILTLAIFQPLAGRAAESSSDAVALKVAGELGHARVSGSGDELVVTTGRLERKWRWTGKGLVTVGLRDVTDGKEWIANAPAHPCDWDLPGSMDDQSDAQLVSMTVRTDDDDGFTGQHLEVVSTVRYEQAKLEVQLVIWAYPDAPGIRTQLRVKALPGFDAKAGRLLPNDKNYQSYGSTQLRPGARAEFLPLDFSVANARRYWGYYNDPGNRHDQSKDMLEEKVVRGFPLFQAEAVNWASGVAVEYGDCGVAVVKESPKCVNQQAHLTGGFFSSPQGLSVTGWGLAPDEIVTNRFRECWATWTMVFTDGNDGLQLALKQFNRARYPVFPERDMFILANTWGPANPGGAQFTDEKFVLQEIPALADLGVDVLQIDDGWQKNGGGSGASGFLPKYKNGWKDIKAGADKSGIRLGLWVAIRNANAADLNHDLDELGFISWKADFERLASRSDYEDRIAKIREVMKHAWMKTQFTLCPEYDDPRYGWYFAQEYGSIYFQNLQEGLPAHLTMVPFQVLRQHWLMAKYFPADKLQVMLQNPQRTRRDLSDAWQHSHAYCFAMGLPFVPCFFQSAQYLDAAGRTELRDLIKVFKSCREDIFTSLTFPIGDLPDNSSWSGFQMVSQQRNGGHLLLFRELHNSQPHHEIELKFLAGKTITLQDLENGEKRQLRVPADGKVKFEINQPAGYRLYRYTVEL